MAKPDAVLVAAFKGLTPKQVGNFRWHMKKGTPIVCSAVRFCDEKGGG